MTEPSLGVGIGRGHVFVIHGDLTKLACDQVLVPTDKYGCVEDSWSQWRPPGGVGDLTGRVSRACEVRGQRVRFIDVGSWPEAVAANPAGLADWLGNGVRDGLKAIVDEDIDRPPAHDRLAPLVGMPLFGTGQGGFDKARGEALRAVLRATSVATEVGLDVVIVCFSRADYAALQAARVGAVWADLFPASVRDEAASLGSSVRDGRLAVFCGAGVSRGAGLPGWHELADKFASVHGFNDLAEDARAGKQLTEIFGEMRERLGDAFEAALTETLRSELHALSHGLVGSLRAPEVATTNIDTLYELATTVSVPQLSVLPWQRSADRQHWIVKLHGDVNHGDLVFTSGEYESFATDRWMVAAVLQGLLVTKDVLFVGYSLHDPNISAIVHDITAALRAAGAPCDHLGTVITLTESERNRIDADFAGLEAVMVGDEVEGVSAADSRRVELFLDLLAWEASREESSWLLDPRYAEMLEGEDRTMLDQVRAVHIPRSDAGDRVRAALEPLGFT